MRLTDFEHYLRSYLGLGCPGGQLFMKREVNNRYVKKCLEEIESDGLSDDNLLSLCWELKYSNMVYPLHKSEKTLKEIDGKDYIPIFTSLDEFKKHYSDDYEDSSVDFGFLLDILDDIPYSLSIIMQRKLPALNFTKDDPLQKSIAEGFIIDDSFIIDGELLGKVRDFYNANPYSKRDLLEIYNSIDNCELEAALNSDFRTIIKALRNSNVLGLYTSDISLDEFAHEGIILWEDFGEYCELFIKNDYGIQYPYIFTSKEAIKNVNVDNFQYANLTGFEDLAKFVVGEGLDGIMINANTDNVYIDRQTIFRNLDLIKYTTDPKYKSANKCIFQI